MFRLIVGDEFAAAHKLSICGEELHGHNFHVWVAVEGNNLDANGMVIDLRVLRGWLTEILEELDHKYLNDLAYFKVNPPTVENIAKYIFTNLNRKIPDNLRLMYVEVWEDERQGVRYYEGCAT